MALPFFLLSLLPRWCTAGLLALCRMRATRCACGCARANSTGVSVLDRRLTSDRVQAPSVDERLVLDRPLCAGCRRAVAQVGAARGVGGRSVGGGSRGSTCKRLLMCDRYIPKPVLKRQIQATYPGAPPIGFLPHSKKSCRSATFPTRPSNGKIQAGRPRHCTPWLNFLPCFAPPAVSQPPP